MLVFVLGALIIIVCVMIALNEASQRRKWNSLDDISHEEIDER